VRDVESAVGMFLKDYLESRDLTVELQEVENSRYNIYAYHGKERNTKVLLTSHIDTVPPFFPYEVKGDRIYGRGSVDAKNCVAAQVVAFEQLLEEGEIGEGDVALLFVVDEEVSGKGMKYASSNLQIDTWKTVIFGEPTENKLGVGHKGLGMATFKAHGKAAHSGYPELGLSANEILINALSSLLAADLPESDLLGPSTLNIGKMQGGVAANVVPAEAEATVAIRIADGYEYVMDLLYETATRSEHLEITDVYSVRPQLVNYDVPGFDNVILAYSTDIPNLDMSINGRDFTRYLYGSGSIHVAHSANEYITFADLIESLDGYKKLTMHGLGHNH
jgi:acetylornithine deacetylase